MGSDALFLAREEPLLPGDLNMVGHIIEKPEVILYYDGHWNP